MSNKTYIRKSRKLAIEVPFLFATAPCRGENEHLFYSLNKETDASKSAYLERLNKARDICSTCPIAQMCEREARSLPRSSQFGIWAGRDLHLHPYESFTERRTRERGQFLI